MQLLRGRPGSMPVLDQMSRAIYLQEWMESLGCQACLCVGKVTLTCMRRCHGAGPSHAACRGVYQPRCSPGAAAPGELAGRPTNNAVERLLLIPGS